MYSSEHDMPQHSVPKVRARPEIRGGGVKGVPLPVQDKYKYPNRNTSVAPDNKKGGRKGLKVMTQNPYVIKMVAEDWSARAARRRGSPSDLHGDVTPREMNGKQGFYP